MFIRGKWRKMGLGRTYKGQARENVMCVEYLPNDKRQGWRKIKGKWYKCPQEVTGGR